jgi:hypothetical protein
MTRKVYKSAMGKEVDLGALLLQNEQVRAVGNMNVNARGDVLDGANRVIDSKNRQTQRQYQRTVSNVSSDAVIQTSTRSAKQAAAAATTVVPGDLSTAEKEMLAEFDFVEEITPVAEPEPLPENVFPPTGEGGLAAAIARSRLIKQEKEKTLREKQQSQGLRKI